LQVIIKFVVEPISLKTKLWVCFNFVVLNFDLN